MSTIVNDLVSHLQCGTSIAANDAIYIDDVTGKIHKYDPTDDTLVFAGIAKEAGVLNDFVRVVQSGRVKGFTGLTPGQFVYASVTVPGSFQLVEPAASQKVILGIAKSATELTINGGLGIKPGGDGSGGGLDAFYVEDMEALADVSDFTTGNNASFLGGGTLQGTLAVESVSPISGLKSLIYTQAAGSLNDYFASELIELDPKQQDNTSGMTLYFTYDGNDNDMKFVVWDVTNSVELSNQVSFVKLASSATRYSLSFYVPASCTQIRWGAQVLVENIGAELVVDDVEMSTDPFHEANLVTERAAVLAAGNAGQALTVNVTNIPFIEVEDELGLWNGTQFTAPSDADYSFSGSIRTTANLTGRVFSYINGVVNKSHSSNANTGVICAFAGSVALTKGQVLSFRLDESLTLSNEAASHHIHIQRIPESTEHVLTPSSTFSTDTAPLTYAGSATYTLATLANAPIGTFITFTYAINTNTRTQTNAAPPTQSTSDMNVNGIQLFTRAYNAASTSGNPAAIAVQIGKGMKGASLNLYKSLGKLTALTMDYAVLSSTSEIGARYKDYDATTGILLVDAGIRETTNTTANFNGVDISGNTSGYLTINAGKTLPLLAVPVPQVAYLKDIKTSGTAGGTFTSGAWQTRTLNTVEGGSSIVSLSANQFTLGPGRYEIEASALGHFVNLHKAKIRNITDSTDALIGTSEVTSPAAVGTNSLVIGTINTTSSKVFELQHRAGTTRATDGFGVATTFGVSEVYAQVIIKKVG